MQRPEAQQLHRAAFKELLAAQRLEEAKITIAQSGVDLERRDQDFGPELAAGDGLGRHPRNRRFAGRGA